MHNFEFILSMIIYSFKYEYHVLTFKDMQFAMLVLWKKKIKIALKEMDMNKEFVSLTTRPKSMGLLMRIGTSM